jgi:hypothetical protein
VEVVGGRPAVAEPILCLMQAARALQVGHEAAVEHKVVQFVNGSPQGDGAVVVRQGGVPTLVQAPDHPWRLCLVLNFPLEVKKGGQCSMHPRPAVLEEFVGKSIQWAGRTIIVQAGRGCDSHFLRGNAGVELRWADVKVGGRTAEGGNRSLHSSMVGVIKVGTGRKRLCVLDARIVGGEGGSDTRGVQPSTGPRECGGQQAGAEAAWQQ